MARKSKGVGLCPLCLVNRGTVPRVASELCRLAFGEQLVSVHLDCAEALPDKLRKLSQRPLDWIKSLQVGVDL